MAQQALAALPAEAPESLRSAVRDWGLALRTRVELGLAREVREAYADAWQAHQESRLNIRQLQVAAERESLLQAEVDSGHAAAPATLHARVESLRLTEQRMEQVQNLSAARNRLVQFAGSNAVERLPPYPLRLDLPLAADRDSLAEQALRIHPELTLARARLAVAEAAAPALRLGPPALGPALAVIWPEAGWAALEARSEPLLAAWLEGTRAAVDSRAAAIFAETENLRGALNTVRHHLALRREHLLPLLERAVESARTEVEAGRQGAEALAEARHRLLHEEMRDAHHQAECLRLAARLDEALGGGWMTEGGE
jgi:outer membrane protein TolC